MPTVQVFLVSDQDSRIYMHDKGSSAALTFPLCVGKYGRGQAPSPGYAACNQTDPYMQTVQKRISM